MGDDVLIEYIARLIAVVRSVKEGSLKTQWKVKLEKFIKHEIWTSSDIRRGYNSLLSRLETRLIEMKVKRRRFMIEIFKREKKKGGVKISEK